MFSIFARDFGVFAVCLAVLVAAVSFAPGPADGFGLRSSSEPGRQPVEDASKRMRDQAFDEFVDKTTDAIEEGAIELGKKGMEWLKKRKTAAGRLAKKAAKRWGPIVKKGLRLSGPVGRVIGTFEQGREVGEKVVFPNIINPLMDRHFDKKWEDQQAELSREIARIRSEGEQQRKQQRKQQQHDDLLQSMVAMKAAMKARGEGRAPTPEDTRNAWAEYQEIKKDAGDADTTPPGKSPWDADAPAVEQAPAARNDPWETANANAEQDRPVAEEPAPTPVTKKDVLDVQAAGHAMKKLEEDDPGRWAGDDPWGTDTPPPGKSQWDADTIAARNDSLGVAYWDAESLRPVVDESAPGPVEDAESGPANYELELNPNQGSGAGQSAGYEKAVEKLVAERRAEEERRRAEAEAERARRRAEAEAARQRKIARAEEERRRVEAHVAQEQATSETARRVSLSPKCAELGGSNKGYCWAEMQSRPGCYALIESALAGLRPDWKGACRGGVADGRGTFSATGDGDDVRTQTGTFSEGKMQGRWVIKVSNLVMEGPYVDGKPNGRWVIRLPDGGVSEGSLVDGEKSGRWVFRHPRGIRSEF